MRQLPALAVVVAAVLGAAAAQTATAAPAHTGTAAADAGPAEWRSYDLLVDLTDLPQPYTCNELWYRLRMRAMPTSRWSVPPCASQLSVQLLPSLPVQPVGAGLTCPAPGTAHRAYALEVQALIPRA